MDPVTAPHCRDTPPQPAISPRSRVSLAAHRIDPTNVSLRAADPSYVRILAFSLVRPDGESFLLRIVVHADYGGVASSRAVPLPQPRSSVREAHEAFAAAAAVQAGALRRSVVEVSADSAAVVQHGRLSFVSFVTRRICEVAEVRGVCHIAPLDGCGVAVSCGNVIYVVTLRPDNGYGLQRCDHPRKVTQLAAFGSRFVTYDEQQCIVWDALKLRVEHVTILDAQVETLALSDKWLALAELVRGGPGCVLSTRSLPFDDIDATTWPIPNIRGYRDSDWSDHRLAVVQDMLICTFKYRQKLFFAVASRDPHGEGSASSVHLFPYAMAYSSVQDSMAPEFVVLSDGTVVALVERDGLYLERFRIPLPSHASLDSTEDVEQCASGSEDSEEERKWKTLTCFSTCSTLSL
ncbi:hypothetical protein FGB62_180g02 [Gracilaria domingensis]|nr:hypothetical protein FGB62_180g02 [Gracilaria domingensis]